MGVPIFATLLNLMVEQGKYLNNTMNPSKQTKLAAINKMLKENSSKNKKHEAGESPAIKLKEKKSGMPS